jgi:lactoylglutathione lyase
MGPRIGALVLFASDLERTVAFYRLLGLPLDVDDHGGDGPLHFACELAGCHVAVFPAAGEGEPPDHRGPGAVLAGFAVDSVEDTVEAVRAFGAAVLQESEPYPWGRRAVVEDPDGRAVEVYQP